MPRGSAPGERRGGRKKGTPNKATSDREQAVQNALDAACTLLSPADIDKLTPADYHDLAWRALVKAKLYAPAMTIAREVMPYRNAKLAPKTERVDENDEPLTGYAVIPQQTETMEAWTAEAEQELAKSGAPSQAPKPSS